MTESVGKLTRRGFAWALGASGTMQIISLVGTIVLARYIAPKEFGIFAATLLFTEVASTVVSAGFVLALVQHQEVSETEYRTTLLSSFGLSLALAFAMAVGAGWISEYYREPRVGPVLGAMAISILILPFTSVPSAMLRKELRFGALAQADVYSSVINSLGAILLAVLFHAGVWSLVLSRIAANLFRGVYVTYLARWMPRFQFDRAAFRRMMPNFSLFAVRHVLNDVASNAPYTLVGRFLGSEALGFYSRAYSMMALPVTKLSGPFAYVLFPAFSQIRGEVEEFHDLFLKSTCGLALMVFPAIVGVMLVARPFVAVVLGPVWLPIVLPLQILCAGGIIFALEPVVISALHAAGYVAQEVGRQVLYLALLAIGIPIGSRFGISGVAWVMLIVSMIHMAMLLLMVQRGLGVSWLRLWESVKPAVVYTAAMGLATGGASLLLRPWIGMDTPAMLALLVAIGIASYAAALLGLSVSEDEVSRHVVRGVRMRILRRAIYPFLRRSRLHEST